MTLFSIRLIFSQPCDWCRKMIFESEMAWWNPKTKKTYHEECQEFAEGI